MVENSSYPPGAPVGPETTEEDQWLRHGRGRPTSRRERPEAPVSRIDHVGIIVDDLEQARSFLGGVLGLELVSEGSSPHTTARYAFFRWGEVQVEILEVTDPEERRRRLGGERLARIEHIGVAVDDLGASIAALRARGVRTTTAEP